MVQRKWSSLSPAYRKRLERAGINDVRYELGAPVTAARGHAKTPERPSRAYKNPSRYPEYLENRTIPADFRAAVRRVSPNISADRWYRLMSGNAMPWVDWQQRAIAQWNAVAGTTGKVKPNILREFEEFEDAHGDPFPVMAGWYHFLSL